MTWLKKIQIRFFAYPEKLSEMQRRETRAFRSQLIIDEVHRLEGSAGPTNEMIVQAIYSPDGIKRALLLTVMACIQAISRKS